MVARGIHDLARELDQRGKHLTIETAATIPPDSIKCHLASLSPKLAHSTPEPDLFPGWAARHEQLRWQPDVLRAWMNSYPFQLKFVVRHEADLAEMEALLLALSRPVPPHKILLMPEGTEIQSLAGRQEFLIEACKSRGYRYCPRIHIAWFGNRRGT
jgi:7-carboxy-7-deazaguanine synthase